MPYLTYVQPSTAVRRDIRLTSREAIEYQLNPTKGSHNRHSKNFFHKRTIYVDRIDYDRINYDGLARLANKVRGTEFTKDYYTFRIPKASGGTRTIEAPGPELKELQADIVDIMTKDLKVLPHNAAYAYTTGRCAYDSLVTHQRSNARWFLKLDIKDFFPSISKEVLRKKIAQIIPLSELFKSTGDAEMVNKLLDIAVNNDDVLPQGSPLSPMLSNLVMVGFDKQLTSILRRFKGNTFTYTRYADDLLISCPYDFKFTPVIEIIEQLFQEHKLPFTINRSKIRYASMAGRNWNLGLMYNHEQKITVGSKRKRHIHALVNNFMNDCNEGQHWNVQDTQELLGQLSYLQNIEPDYHRTLVRKYEQKYQLDIKRLFKVILS